MKQVHEIEHAFLGGHGYLEVICGPMFSGKTEELIRRVRRFQYAKMEVVVFKPHIDTRYEKNLVISHSAQEIQSVCVERALEIKEYIKNSKPDIKVVALDEAQFFSEDIVDVVEELVQKGIRVIAAGLNQDYLARPFGAMPKLLSNADFITKLLAICMKCGNLASKTQRIVPSGFSNILNPVLIGGSTQYEARCRNCYEGKI